MTHPTVRLTAIAFLKANPQYATYGPKRLRLLPDAPTCGIKTWERARLELCLPPLTGNRYATRQQERKAAFAVYPNTHKIIVDTEKLKIVFHGEGGFKVAQKPNKKALSASLRLFRLARFETRSHDTESGIIVLTLAVAA